MQRPAVLTGEKVYLGRLALEDVPTITQHTANLELTTYLRGKGLVLGVEGTRAWVESTLKDTPNTVTLAILNFEHELVGAVDLRGINYQHGTSDLGIALYNPAHWDRGYGSEAVKLILAYGMYHHNLYNVMLKVFSFNPRAIRAYQKVGFREIGRRTGAICLGGRRFDEVFMEITRNDVHLEKSAMFRIPLEE